MRFYFAHEHCARIVKCAHEIVVSRRKEKDMFLVKKWDEKEIRGRVNIKKVALDLLEESVISLNLY